MFFSIRPRRSRWSLVGLGLSLLLLGTCVGLQGLKSAASRPSMAPRAPAAVDPRLILHRRTTSISGAIGGGVSVDGTLTPSLPGLNTIRLHILLPGRQVGLGGRVGLVLSMPGMAMPPVHVTLNAESGDYRGSVALPMFGRYRAEVDAATASGRYTGAISLIMPLTLAAIPTGASAARPYGA
jgi:hypothetical protein